MAKKAENTTQKHVMLVRPYLEEYLPSTLGVRTPGLPTEHDGPLPTNQSEWVKYVHEGPRGWKYERVAGLLTFDFVKPVKWGEARAAFRQIGSPTAQSYPDTRSIVGACSLLTKTSKMGCYSWNMPAGPTDKLGTCPGSRLGYRIWAKKPDKKGQGGEVLQTADGELQQATQEEVLKAVRIAQEKNRALRAAVPTSVDDARSKFICNGCYAMKNAYGNPSVVTVMQWRKVWRDWALQQDGEFVDVLVEAIRLAREKSRNAPPPTRPEQIAEMTHPNFFRIHDSGDFDSPEYFLAWLEICRKLPYIHFWAPTRVWADPVMSKFIEQNARHIPPNLALRPSSLFFDGPYPEIPWLSAGASSTLIEVHSHADKLTVDIPAVANEAWGCPAYLPSIIGGGALPKRKRAQKGEKEEERKLVKAETVSKRGRKANPVSQSFSLFPQLDETVGLDPKLVFYDALVDENGQWIIDSHTGQPLPANKKNKKLYPKATVARSQAFQTAGACSLARDHKGAMECRVCWNVSGNEQDAAAKRLPVVYGKH